MAEGVVSRIYGNLARLLGGKAGAGLVSLAYLAVAARALGPAEYGVLVLVHTYVMTVGGVVECQGWHAVVRYGAQASAAGDRPRLVRLMAFVAAVELGFGMLAVGVAALLAPILGPRLGWSSTALGFALPYSLAVLASIRSTPAGYLQLVRRFDLLGAHNLVAPVVRLTGALVVLATHAGLKGFLVAWLVAALAEWSAMWLLGAWAARGQLSRADLRGGRLTDAVRDNPGLLRFMAGAKADVTLSELAGRIAPQVVGGILGPAAAGLYAIGQRATSVLAQPGLTLGQAAYAELARLAAAGDRGPRIRAAVRRTVGIAVLAALPVCLAVAVAGRPIAVLLAGKAFAAAGGIMLWLTLARTVLLAAPPLSAALTALGRPGLSVSANAVAGLGLLLVLPPMLDWQGLGGAGMHALMQAIIGVGLLGAYVWRETAAPHRTVGAPA